MPTALLLTLVFHIAVWKRKCSCGSFLDRSLHTSVTTYCSCSLRALLWMCHGVSTAWKCQEFPPHSLKQISENTAKYAKFPTATWESPETVPARGMSPYKWRRNPWNIHLSGLKMSSCQLPLTEKKHTHICVWELAGVCSEVLSKTRSMRFLFPQSRHQGCLMALEIRAPCLFACSCETALHQMEDLFVCRTTSVCLCVHVRVERKRSHRSQTGSVETVNYIILFCFPPTLIIFFFVS